METQSLNKSSEEKSKGVEADFKRILFFLTGQACKIVCFLF